MDKDETNVAIEYYKKKVTELTEIINTGMFNGYKINAEWMEIYKKDLQWHKNILNDALKNK